MPIDGSPLIIEPTFPMAAELMAMGQAKAEPDDQPNRWEGAKVRNIFWSWRYRCDVAIIEHEGKITYGMWPKVHGGPMLLQTLGASFAWGIEQEGTAVHTLGTLLRHAQFKQYLLTGMFIEHSPRSGLFYLFRKLRPTIVMTPHKGEAMQILCCLCLHPIGYYQGSWAGAMCPTDDVIAHLMLMRGDEPMLWKRANQHPSYRPAAGL